MRSRLFWSAIITIAALAGCTAPEDVILVQPEPIGLVSAPVPTPPPAGYDAYTFRTAPLATVTPPPVYDPVAPDTGPGVLLDLDDDIGITDHSV